MPSEIEKQKSVDPPCWSDLKRPLVDLMLKFYNGEDSGSEFV